MVAEYLGYFQAGGSQGGITSGSQWLVWRFESDSTLADACDGALGPFPVSLASPGSSFCGGVVRQRAGPLPGESSGSSSVGVWCDGALGPFPVRALAALLCSSVGVWCDGTLGPFPVRAVAALLWGCGATAAGPLTERARPALMRAAALPRESPGRLRGAGPKWRPARCRLPDMTCARLPAPVPAGRVRSSAGRPSRVMERRAVRPRPAPPAPPCVSHTLPLPPP